MAACVTCNGTGVIVLWNLVDDSGDSVEICNDCCGYGYLKEPSK